MLDGSNHSISDLSVMALIFSAHDSPAIPRSQTLPFLGLPSYRILMPFFSLLMKFCGQTTASTFTTIPILPRNFKMMSFLRHRNSKWIVGPTQRGVPI